MAPRALALTTLLALTLATEPAVAQVVGEGTRVPPGTRARIRAPGGAWHTGRFVGMRADSVLLASDEGGPVRAFARADVETLQVSHGMRTHRLFGGLAGMLVGGSVGAMLGHLASSREERSCPSPPVFGCMELSGLGQLYGTVLGSIVGTIGGGVVGVRLGGRPREDWRLPVPARSGHLPQPTPPHSSGFVGLVVSVPF